MRYRIKVRLAELNKTQTCLLDELRARGYTINTPSELNRFINDRVRTPKAERVLDECDRIITEWESHVRA